jgi:hypothetical protein
MATYEITLGAGSYTLTGTSLGVLCDRVLVLGSGSYALTGTAMGFVYGYIFELGGGAYTLTGTDVGIKASRVLTLGSGAYTLTGTAVSFGLTTAETARASVIVYLFTLTGAADGVADVEIPITSLQARMRSGSPTYLQVVIPGLSEYETYVTDRPNGTMEIDVAYMEDGVYALRETIISVALDDIRVDWGPMSKSISLTGRSQKTYANKAITLHRPIYRATLNGATRYRFAEPVVYLFPGDTVTVDSDVFVANTVSYYVRARRGGMETRMEVAETAA